jgi:flavin reductase (DIM6/NTAB) family NADH-FMN oxidoreductase RutF
LFRSMFFIGFATEYKTGVRMTSFVNLPLEMEALTLLNIKPAVIVTTKGKDGSTNAAPYSWFSVVDYNPPRVLLSSNMKRDTFRNILETHEFVLNFPGADLLKQIWTTSKHFPYGVNELEEAGLTWLPSEKVKPPRIKECRVHMECKVIWTKPIGAACVILAEIVSLSIDKEMRQLGAKDRLIRLNPPLYFSFKQDKKTRKWSFATIGVIHDVQEEDGRVNIKSEAVGC